MKGVVFYFEMKYLINFGKVVDLVCFEVVVSNVFEVYWEVWNFFLMYFYFLIGEVEVWFVCLKWIMNEVCNGDIEVILEFVINKLLFFFRICISDFFYFLDIVDGIV